MLAQNQMFLHQHRQTPEAGEGLEVGCFALVALIFLDHEIRDAPQCLFLFGGAC